MSLCRRTVWQQQRNISFTVDDAPQPSLGDTRQPQILILILLLVNVGGGGPELQGTWFFVAPCRFFSQCWFVASSGSILLYSSSVISFLGLKVLKWLELFFNCKSLSVSLFLWCGLVLILNSLPATGRRVLTGCGMLRRIKAVAGEEAARDQAESLRSSRQTSVLEHRAL